MVAAVMNGFYFTIDVRDRTRNNWRTGRRRRPFDISEFVFSSARHNATDFHLILSHDVDTK